MSFYGPNEDAYWENFRENYEHGFRPMSEWDDLDKGPEYEERSLFLDEEGQIEDLEEEFGYPMEEIDEDDLVTIVNRMTGDKPDEDHEISWNPRNQCIDYSVAA